MSGTTYLSDQQRRLILQNLPAQRWYAGGNRHPVAIEIVREQPIMVLEGEVAVLHLLIRADDDIYQHVIAIRPYSDQLIEELRARGEIPLIDSNSSSVICDALGDPDGAVALLQYTSGQQVQRTEAIRLIGTSQFYTNSLTILERAGGSVEILKLYRRLRINARSEYAITRRLIEAGFNNVPRPHAVWRLDASVGSLANYNNVDLLFSQEYLPNAQDMYTAASEEVAYFIERRLANSAAPLDTREQEFFSVIYAIGAMTGHIHRVLARSGKDNFDKQEIIDELREQAEHVALTDSQKLHLNDLIARIDEMSEVGMSIELNWDFHLGNVLKVGDEIFSVDWEGSQGPDSAATPPSTPLRDIASLVGSLNHAAISKAMAMDGGDRTLILHFATEWEKAAVDSFVAGYFSGPDSSVNESLLPPDAQTRNDMLKSLVLLRSFADWRYAVAHRAAWVGVPVRMIESILGPFLDNPVVLTASQTPVIELGFVDGPAASAG